MNKYYVLDSDPYDFDHMMRIGFPEGFQLNMKAIYYGERQFIDDTEEFLVLAKRTEELPDIYNYDIPLISQKVKDILDDMDIENIFYKPAVLVETEDIHHFYYIPVIRPIECVVWDKSTYEPKGSFKKIKGSFYIDNSKVGYYKIFKIKDAINEIWIINDELKEAFEKADVKGIKMIQTENFTG